MHSNLLVLVNSGLYSGDGVQSPLCFLQVEGPLVVPTFDSIHSLNFIIQLCFLKGLVPSPLLLNFVHLLKRQSALGGSA